MATITITPKQQAEWREAVQRAAMKVIKPGAIGGEIYTVAEERLKKSKIHNHTDFLAHGMGLVTYLWDEVGLKATGKSLERSLEDLVKYPLGTCVYLRVDWRHLHKRLGRLEPDRQRMLLLAYYGAFSREQLSVKLDMPVNLLRASLRRSLAEVEQCLKS